jgi:23S rRNA pseudouridine2605 synthase
MALRKRPNEKQGDKPARKNTFEKTKRTIRTSNVRDNDNHSFRDNKKPFDADRRKSDRTAKPAYRGKKDGTPDERFSSNKFSSAPRGGDRNSKPAYRGKKDGTPDERFSSNKFSSAPRSGDRTPYKKTSSYSRNDQSGKVYSSDKGKYTGSKTTSFRSDDRKPSLNRFSRIDSEKAPSTFKKDFVKKPYNRKGADDTENKRPVERSSRFSDKPHTEFKRTPKGYVAKPYNRKGADDTESKRPTERTSRFSDKPNTEFKRSSKTATAKPFNRKGENELNKRTEDSPRLFEKIKPETKRERKVSRTAFKAEEKRVIEEKAKPRSKKGEDLVRLNRYISNAGICSRREADKLIATGLVSVNGEVVTEMGYQVKNEDDVRFNGQRLSREKKVYIIMNKPKDSITTLDDPDGRKTIMDVLGNEIRERIFPVGRLDRNTTGVLLLTNDGELAQRLMHPKYEVEKVYKATLNKVFKGEDFWQLTNGIELEDGPIKPDELAYPDPKNKCEVGVLIHSGRNRIIHRMFEHMGYLLDRLDRVSYGGFVKTGLKRGEWRHLADKEISQLKRLAKLG